MGALNLILRADLRHRWRSWLALAVLVSVAGGLVLASMAAGRRTSSAFPEFIATRGFDVVVYATEPVPGIAKLPGVTRAVEGSGLDTGQPTCDCAHPINPTDFGVIGLPSRGPRIYKLVSGHTPSPSAADQVLASFTLAQSAGVHIGSVIHVPFYAASQLSAFNNAVGAPPMPAGPTIAFRVVGFEANEFEFPTGGTPSYDLYTTSAFARDFSPRIAGGYVYFVRLRDGASEIPHFTAEASAVSPTGVEAAQSEDSSIASVEASIHPQAVGWWILAALAALVGLGVLGQALFRQSIAESDNYPAMTAVGADRKLLFRLGMARTLVVAVSGAVGALAIATLLSPIAPLGEARTAEVSTGVSFDTVVLLLGAVAIVAVVVALGVWPAYRGSRVSGAPRRSIGSRPSSVVSQLAAAGAPPSAVIGVRHALERKSGGSTVPVGSAIIGTVLAVTALCGTAVFGTSLSHLTSTPRLYGEPFQLNFTSPNGGTNGPDPGLLNHLRHDKNVTAITEGIAIQVAINRVSVGAIAGTAIRGALPFSTVSGHLPAGDGQVGLGATTMRQIGAHVGSIVQVTFELPSGGTKTAPFRVVSSMSLPVLGGVVSLGSGALFTLSGYGDALCPGAAGRSQCLQTVSQYHNGGVLAAIAPGPHQRRVINEYLDSYQSTAALPATPTSLVNFGEAVNFPLIFGGILALFGAATLVHLLVVSVTRRKSEIGLLKVLGFVNHQVAAAVSWQATALSLIGILVGVPLGVVVGQVVWRAFAGNLGVVPVSIVPAALIVALAAGVLVASNLIAFVPALAATRSRPQQLLRTQ